MVNPLARPCPRGAGVPLCPTNFPHSSALLGLACSEPATLAQTQPGDVSMALGSRVLKRGWLTLSPQLNWGHGVAGTRWLRLVIPRACAWIHFLWRSSAHVFHWL